MRKLEEEVIVSAVNQFVGLSVVQFELIKYSEVSVFDPVYRSIERKLRKIEKLLLSQENAWEEATDIFASYLMEQM